MLVLAKKKISISNILLLLLLITIWAFNEDKIITYPTKIVFILVYGYKWIKGGIIVTKYQAWCIVMIALSGVALIWAQNYEIAIHTFINVLQVFLIGFTLSASIETKDDVERLLQYIVIAGIVLSVRLVIKTPLSVWVSFQRLGQEIGYNSNDVGNKAAIASIIALCLYKNKKEIS